MASNRSCSAASGTTAWDSRVHCCRFCDNARLRWIDRGMLGAPSGRYGLGVEVLGNFERAGNR